MKKLMVAFAAVAVATGAFAAQVDWQASVMPIAGLTMANYTAYMIDAAGWDSYIKDGKLDKTALASPLDSSGFVSASSTKYTTNTQTFESDAGSVSYKMLLVDTASDKWAIIKEGSVVPYDPEKGSGTLQSVTVTAQKILGTATSGNLAWGQFQSVPEPTSGLLLLLGVAGLALRRRRA